MSQIVYPPNTDLLINGQVACTSLNVGTATITDAMMAVPSLPGSALATTKQRHRTIRSDDFNGSSTTTGAAVIKPAHAVYGTAGTVVAFGVGSVAIAVGAATVVCDLLKNGTTILTGTITLDSSNVARVIEAAPGFTSIVLAAGDLLEAKITSATAGGGTIPVGVFFRLIVDEDPS